MNEPNLNSSPLETKTLTGDNYRQPGPIGNSRNCKHEDAAGPIGPEVPLRVENSASERPIDQASIPSKVDSPNRTVGALECDRQPNIKRNTSERSVSSKRTFGGEPQAKSERYLSEPKVNGKQIRRDTTIPGMPEAERVARRHYQYYEHQTEFNYSESALRAIGPYCPKCHGTLRTAPKAIHDEGVVIYLRVCRRCRVHFGQVG